MADPVIRALSHDADIAAVQDLCLRASDYIMLETGAPPAADYAAKLVAEAPPNLPSDDVFAFVAQGDAALLGIVTCLRNFYQAGEWYMGLLLLDPHVRGAGLGTRMVRHVFERAQAQGAKCIRVAVLDANTAGRAFWDAQGFELERTVAGDPEGDGHMRHVLKLKWEE